MTYISYIHKSSNGDVTVVKTLREAEELKRTMGGSYNIDYDVHPSQEESHCRLGARHAGELK